MAQPGGIIPGKGELMGKTRELKNFKADPGKRNIAVRDEKGLLWNRGKRKSPPVKQDPTAARHREDPLRQRGAGAGRITALGSSNQLSPEFLFDRDGMGSLGITPADPTLCVGPSHLVQMVNGPSGALFQVFDKAGSPLTEPIYLDNLADGAGYSGAGDGICLYDQLADRYILTEFGTPAGSSDINTLIMYVSVSNDPLGQWYIYKFTDAGFFPDYPKFSVWQDAWYATSRDFTLPDNNFAGISFYAFNKAQMIAGAATVQLQRIRLTDVEKYDGAAPINIFGSDPPPSGTPGLFAYRNDDGRTSAPDADSIGLLAFTVDFSNPEASSLTPAGSLATAAFQPIICEDGGYFQACVTTPGNFSKLMATSAFVMDKPVYRRFATHESILVFHTVNAGNSTAAFRWHELRRTSGNWQLYQEGTYSPDDTHRFYPSMNMNAQGQIMAVYNTSSVTIWPSITVTGRNAGDPIGTLPADETMVAAGTGYGTFSSRWGDYNMIAPDPVNDSLFWLTSMYGDPAGWKTRVTAVKLAPNKNLDAKLSAVITPLNGQSFCDAREVSARVKIGNSGNTTLRTLQINWQVNGGVIRTYNWTGTLAYGGSEEVDLPLTITGTGTFQLKFYTSAPNGGTDERRSNDTFLLSIQVQQPLTGGFTQGFENATFPPAGWKVINPNAGTITWARTISARKSGMASVYMNLFNYDKPDERDFLVSPGLSLGDADSVIIHFSHAYKTYSGSGSFADSLLLMASTDCGNNFDRVIWKKGGSQLASTAGSTGDINWVPVASEWADNRISLPAATFAGAENISFAWVSVNKFGQNIYLDDINVQAYRLPRLDITVSGMEAPSQNLCSAQFEPVIRVRNNGLESVQQFLLYLRWDDGPLVSRKYEGLNLATGEEFRINYDSVFQAGQAGRHRFTVYVSLPNGQPDQLRSNDTLEREVYVFRTETAPLVESFEQELFPPDNWNTLNPDGGIGWEQSREAATNGNRSAYIRNFVNPVPADIDELVTPPVVLPESDSLFLAFDLAHIASRPDGEPTDTLEIFLTRDCGNTLEPIYKKWGTLLQTTEALSQPANREFVPTTTSLWRRDSIDLGILAQAGETIQVVFRNTANRNNNLYLDDIRLYAVNLPIKLKTDGFLVTPNPSNGILNIRQYLVQVNLKTAEVLNILGQRIWTRSYTGDAPTLIQADISNQPPGIYIVRLVYHDKVRSVRIIKTNR